MNVRKSESVLNVFECVCPSVFHTCEILRDEWIAFVF